MRLKRSRLIVEDFEPLRVIGKGAFGEVSHHEKLFQNFTLVKLMMALCCSVGSAGAEEGYGPYFCYEGFAQSRYA